MAITGGVGSYPVGGTTLGGIDLIIFPAGEMAIPVTDFLAQSDVANIFNPLTGTCDFALNLDTQQLESNEDLLTSITISLLADRLALPSDELPTLFSDDRRGWWGDPYLIKDQNVGQRLGSRLWLLTRSKTSENLLPLAKNYAAEALAWLTDHKIAASVDIKTYFYSNDVSKLGIDVTVSRVGKPPFTVTYLRYLTTQVPIQVVPPAPPPPPANVPSVFIDSCREILRALASTDAEPSLIEPPVIYNVSCSETLFATTLIGVVATGPIVIHDGCNEGSRSAVTTQNAAVTPAGTSTSTLQVTLNFIDGKSLTFRQSSATDMGDYQDAYIHQKCYRQVASGNGDYRDAFLVFFRPDADGTRDEVIVEFGTLYNFATSPPTSASGVVPQQLLLPPKAKVTRNTGGTSVQSGPTYFAISYVRPEGESVATHPTAYQISLNPGDYVSVTPPPAIAGALGYNVYAYPFSFSSTYYKQNASVIPFGTTFTTPTTGLLTSGTTFPTTSAYNAYTAVISGGTLTTPVTVPVSNHWWPTRWRFKTSDRTVVRPYNDLVTLKAIAPMSSTYRGTGAFGAPPKSTWSGPMGTGGLNTAMPDVADHPDLGPITEWQGYYLMADATYKDSIMAQAEAVGSMRIWIRDRNTGALVDPGAHPYIAFNDANGGINAIPIPDVVPSGASSYFTMDVSHLPAAAFVPYMLTSDPYFLEGHQALAVYGILESNLSRLNNKLQRLSSVAQPRAIAWNWRDIFRSAMFTPSTTPSWLMSKATWQLFIPDQVTYVNNFINSTTNPVNTVFKFFPQSSNTESFMLHYIACVVGWIKWTGQFPTMDAAVNYIATPLMTMGDPTNASGWDHRFQMFYYGPIIDARLGATATGNPTTYYGVAANANTPTTWAELFTDLCAWGSTQSGFVQPANLVGDTYSPYQKNYLPLVRAGLASLTLAGIPGASTAHDWLASKVVLEPTLWEFTWKFAISPT